MHPAPGSTCPYCGGWAKHIMRILARNPQRKYYPYYKCSRGHIWEMPR